MANVYDVAAYILTNKGEMTAMKLQKLVYYSQAWSLVWDEKPLFRERIEAWANGPVSPELYRCHAGEFRVKNINAGDPGALDATEAETVDVILEYYGDKDSQWLSDLTHSEAPWINARGTTLPGERCSNEIKLADMAEYYGSL
jgi:uncharacterized phage-associated protein